MSTEHVFDPNKPAHLGRLRNLVAGMIKDLLAARAVVDPAWCDNENIDPQWFFATPRPTAWSPIYLLDQAALGFRRIHEDCRGPLDSRPRVEEDDETPTALVERLKDLLSQFVTDEELMEAADVIRHGNGSSVKWDDLANWRLLPQLRDLLDELPESPNQPGPRVEFKGLSIDSHGMYYEGRRVDCPPQPQSLLRLLLQQRGRRCHLQDLAVAIWNEQTKVVTAQDASSALKRTREWLRESQIPLYVGQRGNDIYLIEVPPEPIP